jgi:hypothetical protein
MLRKPYYPFSPTVPEEKVIFWLFYAIFETTTLLEHMTLIGTITVYMAYAWHSIF